MQIKIVHRHELGFLTDPSWSVVTVEDESHVKSYITIPYKPGSLPECRRAFGLVRVHAKLCQASLANVKLSGCAMEIVPDFIQEFPYEPGTPGHKEWASSAWEKAGQLSELIKQTEFEVDQSHKKHADLYTKDKTH